MDTTPLELIERELCELSAHLSVGMCRWLMLVSAFEERRGWIESGAWSCAHWLSWRCGIGLRAAREQVRVAKSLTALPQISAAFAAGELSYSKVRAVTRVATPENEEYLLMLARHATGSQLERIVSSYRRVLPTDGDQARRAYDGRYLYTRYTEDGSLIVEARVPADEGAVLLAALDQAAAQAGAEREQCSAEHREAAPTIPAARADALIGLARAQLASDASERAGPEPVEVVVHVDVECLTSDASDGRCQLEEGAAIAPETARRLACDGGVRRVIERDGRPLTVGRRRRSVSPALKRALRDRDHGCCQFPGCTHRRYLHAHHIHHWARGGPTTLDNLVQLCSYHHRLVHEGGYAVERAGRQGLRFVRPDGRAIEPQPAMPVATGPPLAERSRARGVVIDTDTCKPIDGGRWCDYGMAVDSLLQRDGRLDYRPHAPPDT